MAAPAHERPALPVSAPKGDGPARGSRKVKREQGRWVREVKGILALALSGFGFVALYAYDPTLHLFDQTSPVGPVGVWLGWVFFWAFGYAGYLFPLLLAGYGASAFIRSRMVTGWPAAVGLGLLLISVTGILTRLSDTLAVQRIHKGGVLGWAVSEALRASMGSVGTWIIVLAIIPVAVLFITRVSLRSMSQAAGQRLWGRPLSGEKAAGARAAAPRLDPAIAPDEPIEPPRLVVKEPPKPKGSRGRRPSTSARAARAPSSFPPWARS